MKDLGFNEFGELSATGDEESAKMNSSVEMTNQTTDNDPTGEDEAEDTEIAI